MCDHRGKPDHIQRLEIWKLYTQWLGTCQHAGVNHKMSIKTSQHYNHRVDSIHCEVDHVAHLFILSATCAWHEFKLGCFFACRLNAVSSRCPEDWLHDPSWSRKGIDVYCTGFRLCFSSGSSSKSTLTLENMNAWTVPSCLWAFDSQKARPNLSTAGLH